ncbi:hypothetical protein CI238_05588 [Colletotrichum incanum]|uniref:Uncharacterized protein n=1 Tax=Colletotrichum incanum TaxID=1573173 RepID=A0A162PYE8_COLIC|nr:hypothetical protein CI238_05588 [Colletotrichum incanum]
MSQAFISLPELCQPLPPPFLHIANLFKPAPIDSAFDLRHRPLANPTPLWSTSNINSRPRQANGKLDLQGQQHPHQHRRTGTNTAQDTHRTGHRTRNAQGIQHVQTLPNTTSQVPKPPEHC